MSEISGIGTPLPTEGGRSSASHYRLSNGRLKDEYYAPIQPDHFAIKPRDKVLDIGIIGAGIAGLAAASALVQSGHSVDVGWNYSRTSNA